MAGEAEVQVSHFLDEHGVGAFQVKLIFWSILIALIDGYDIGAIAFAAPHLIAEWHVPPKSLALVLSASNIGILFGSQIFGNFLDRVCHSPGTWTMEKFVDQAIADIMVRVGPKDRVVCGLSGGVDSAVCAALLARALGPRAFWVGRFRH